MRRVGVREFKEHASALLSGSEPLLVERHGTPIGYYVPIQPLDPVAKKEALDRFGALMERARLATGLTAEEFEAEFLADLPE